ncbi:hemolysin D [Caballeronia udeis]|uniref:Membrane fusion protein (MFP) family protein n=1 Tax=Caballeronia udeis TaxID=1232866 RepID=A0ABW8MXF4_9BURK
MNSIRLQAIADLWRRYSSIFRAAYEIRHQLDAPQRLGHELAFMPANLELVDTPVHPAPRWTMRIIVALALIIVLISLLGKLDIVATAKGKLIPNARVKIIQPAITGVVRQISVRDGQRVKEGDPLLTLDTTQAAADSDKARASKIDAALAIARSQALLGAQQRGHSPIVAAVHGASADDHQQAQHYADGLYREYQDKLASAEAELGKRTGELDSTVHEIEKLEATAPLTRQAANDYKGLAAGKYVANTDYLQKEQTALEQEHELEAQRSHRQQLAAAVVQQHAEIASTTSQFRRAQLDELDKASQQLTQSTNDETKAQTRQGLLTLSAPVAGTVQQLAAHTLGGVVTTAQAVMEIVPDDSVEVEANIENKDIGFVKVGQDAIVKIEAFPYTRYGFLKGKVTSVSNDATQDKKLGLTFIAHVKLPTNQFRVNDKLVDLTPGMEVTAEVKTGTQSVAHYFLDPLVQTAQESMRER